MGPISNESIHQLNCESTRVREFQLSPNCFQVHLWDSHETDQKSLVYNHPPLPAEYTQSSASAVFLISAKMHQFADLSVIFKKNFCTIQRERKGLRRSSRDPVLTIKPVPSFVPASASYIYSGCHKEAVDVANEQWPCVRLVDLRWRRRGGGEEIILIQLGRLGIRRSVGE